MEVSLYSVRNKHYLANSKMFAVLKQTLLTGAGIAPVS